MILDDPNGIPRVEIGTYSLVIRDATGRPVWSSPKGMGGLPATG